MEGYLSLKDTMTYLQITKAHIEKLVRSKRLIAYKLGGKYLRFKKEEVMVLKHELEQELSEGSLLSHAGLQSAWENNRFYLAASVVLFSVYVYCLMVQG